MERTIFRAIIVLSMLGVLIGGPMIYIGKQNTELWWKLHSDELKKSDSPAFTECFKRATPTKDGEEVKLCYDLFGPSVQLLSEWTDKAKRAQTMVGAGIVVSCILPPTLFALFFIIRWIVTGRWRRPKAEIQ